MGSMLTNLDKEYDKRYGTGKGDHKGMPLQEYTSNVLGIMQNKYERLKFRAGNPPSMGKKAVTGHMINEILPGLHKQQYHKTKTDNSMNELDRIAKRRR